MKSIFKQTTGVSLRGGATVAAAVVCSAALGLPVTGAWGQTPNTPTGHAGNPPTPHMAQHTGQHGTQSPASAAAARNVLPFDEKTWTHLLQHGPRPAAYLFTTSYCSTCPAAFAVLNGAVKNRKDKPELNAVMMDVTGPQALRHAAHFNGMSRMFAFEGFEPAIRQAIDPAWPNVTPYVVLVDKQGQTQRVIGPPTPSMVRRWLGGS